METNNSNAPEIKGSTLMAMFLRIRDEELRNARTNEFDDAAMARREASIIYNMAKESLEKGGETAT